MEDLVSTDSKDLMHLGGKGAYSATEECLEGRIEAGAMGQNTLNKLSNERLSH
jgi:hypothetical protein